MSNKQLIKWTKKSSGNLQTMNTESSLAVKYKPAQNDLKNNSNKVHHLFCDVLQSNVSSK